MNAKEGSEKAERYVESELFSMIIRRKHYRDAKIKKRRGKAR